MLLILWAAAITGCSLVDENMTDCETDYQLDYRLQLVTNMTTELQTQLSMAADVQLVTALKTHLEKVFTDYAHDVNLSFYDVEGDSLCLHHESHIMDANQSSYTLYIPVRRYMHLAAANVEQNGQVFIKGDEKCHSARLEQSLRDTLDSHKSGIFTARLPMDVKEGVDQEFDVRLYMANCASALVLDTLGSHIRDVKVFTSGFATSFDVADSAYHFPYTPIVRTEKVDVEDNGIAQRLCYVSVNFPSPEAPGTKVIINSDDPFAVTENATEALWRFKIYVRTQDGSVTETVLGVLTPLRPGQVKLVQAQVSPDGSVAPDNEQMIVLVKMNWTSGMSWNVGI